MATIKVRVTTPCNTPGVDVIGGLFDHESRVAVLTTDHSASSYGLPVLVLDGAAVGPAELPRGCEVRGGEDEVPLYLVTRADSSANDVPAARRRAHAHCGARGRLPGLRLDGCPQKSRRGGPRAPPQPGQERRRSRKRHRRGAPSRGAPVHPVRGADDRPGREQARVLR
jgi:hypothetical protein